MKWEEEKYEEEEADELEEMDEKEEKVEVCRNACFADLMYEDESREVEGALVEGGS